MGAHTTTKTAADLRAGDRITTQRLGTPIKATIKTLHNTGYGIILAWVDDEGLTGSSSYGFRSTVPVHERLVTIDALAEAATDVHKAHSLDGYARGRIAAARSWRRLVVKRALRQGMHPWTVANYAGLAESYVRSLVPAAERGADIAAVAR